ncbi:hypothetical protein chiPu_0007650 [Chiloscyllium punctatum]|uniref:Uncharacterized protein n=1 Tax=Chiloscyllium punctatum TaxID=137246 RepID=A0A401SFT1_CHIPU|nr:hypothetical protein [Chiloscyllium punctatum]
MTVDRLFQFPEVQRAPFTDSTGGGADPISSPARYPAVWTSFPSTHTGKRLEQAVKPRSVRDADDNSAREGIASVTMVTTD